MKLYSVWLIVLTMLLGTAPASAANVNFNGGVVGNCPLTGSTYNCSASFSMGATDFVVIAGGYTVVMTSFSPSYNQGLTIASTGALQTGGNMDLSNINPANVSTGGSTLTAGGSFSLGSAVAINGSVSAASFTTSSPGSVSGSINSTGTVFIGSHVTVGGSISGTTITTNSPVTLNGAINASVAFTLASGSSLTGNITAPKVTLNDAGSTIKGNINTTGALYVGSSNTVTGTVNAGSLNMHASGATINGATTVSGDVDMESGSVINGDLSARNVTTHASNAVINGNAAVNAIYIDWNNSVTKTITCTGPGAVLCSCVTKADPNYKPTCGAPPSAVPHHFQLSHTGTALTCQPQTVTVTACANAACSAPHFTSNVDVTTTPGGKVFTVSGGVNNAATVQSKDAGTFAVGASAPGVSNATVCVNTTTGASNSGAACNMTFSTSGLKVTATNHVSMAPGAVVTVEALTASAGNQSCVPLVPAGTSNVDMACTFSNPVIAANVPVTIGTKNLSCGAGVAGAAVSVPFSFNANGIASLPLSYAEVGQVGLGGSIVTSNFQAVGNGSFIAAPKELQLTATQNAVMPPATQIVTIGPTTAATVPSGVFAKASQAFTLKVTAVNNNNLATSNFGKESTPSKVKLAATINDPNTVAGLTGVNTGGALSYAFPAFSGGSSSAAASFNDVGYLKIVASLDNNPYYLGQQISSFQTTGLQYVSRFIPDHFDTELVPNTATFPERNSSGRTMGCTGLSISTNPCGSGPATSFIYSKQPFLLKVKAYNGASNLLQNYNGSLAKVIDISAATAPGGDTLIGTTSWSSEPNNPPPGRFTFPPFAIPQVDTLGVGTLTNPGPTGFNLPIFSLSSAYPDNDIVPVTIYVRAVDADGASSKRTNAIEAPLAVVSGRMLVSNNYGSPKSRLPVKVYAQYYMPGGYVFNPQVIDLSNGTVASFIQYGNCQKALDTSTNNSHVCATNPSPFKLTSPSAGMTLKNGVGSFSMEPPTPTLTGIGTVDVILKKTTNNNSVIIYLPSTTGRETFGVYRSGPVIYTREQY